MVWLLQQHHTTVVPHDARGRSTYNEYGTYGTLTGGGGADGGCCHGDSPCCCEHNVYTRTSQGRLDSKLYTLT